MTDLLSGIDTQPTDRTVNMSQGQYEEDRLAKNRDYHNNRNASLKDVWRQQRDVVEEFRSQGELLTYIKAKQYEQHETRIGNHTIKVNAYELAVIYLVTDSLKCRSTREGIIRLCNEHLGRNK
jgi:hypothetical protein